MLHVINREDVKKQGDAPWWDDTWKMEPQIYTREPWARPRSSPHTPPGSFSWELYHIWGIDPFKKGGFTIQNGALTMQNDAKWRFYHQRNLGEMTSGAFF